MGKEIGLQVDRQNVLIKYAVTDGDGRGAEGINDALKVLHPLWKVERQADPIHLGRSQFRQSNSANFSLNMFSGSTREKKKKQGQKVLSQDLKARCSLVFNEMWKENCGNLEKIKNAYLECLMLLLPDVEGNPGSAKLLRPHPKSLKILKKEAIFESHDEIHVKDDTYRAVKMKKITLLINVVVNLHNLQDIKCENPNFELTKVIKYGSGVKCIYKCTKCKFTSPRVNLFDEIKTSKPGPNPGELTRMFVSALQETPMGIKRRRFLMAAGLNIPPPTKRTLQRHSNVVANEIKELNDNDMKKKLETVKDVNRIRGVKEPSHIPVAIDTRYNSMHIVSTKKPGQNASQAISLACEQVTDHKFIVASVFHNKLCWTGAWLKGKGLDVTCPDGHAGTCTANVKPTTPLSEYLMGKEIGLQVDRQNVLIKYAVTDGDGRGAEGINDALKVLHPLWKVERQADPIHLGRSQFRQSNSANFSLNMFSGSTREKKKQGQKVLSQDLKARCSLVFNEMWKENCGNLEKIKKCLPRVLDATVRCYTGITYAKKVKVKNLQEMYIYEGK
ncbi:unnamed protein product [Mytilus coruscus]|uniref:Mutator-like transposase domain-containing protein n=1 Tax=Mytilus coruscus TaxID=42192 RepID=A0A6J8DD44_MYTCO|nr:unnamed protein product [Mytilus coruscus]